MNPRSQTSHLPRLLLLSLLCLLGVPLGLLAQENFTPQQMQAQTQKRPLIESIKAWLEQRKAKKAYYADNSYTYGAKQPLTDSKQLRDTPPYGAPQTPPIQYDWRERTYQFSKGLDKLNKEVEEWGTIQMAPLVLSPARYFKDHEKYPFELDVDTPAEADPPKQGEQAPAPGTGKPNPLALQGMYNEYGKAEGGSFSIVRQQFKGSGDVKLTGSGAQAAPLLNPDPANKDATPPVGTTLQTLGDSAGNALVSTSKLDVSTATFSPHSRLVSAADTTQVKNILTLMGKPEAALQYKDRKLLYGVTTVSVNPGWRTKTDYVAHIDAAATVTYRKASREMIAKLIRWKHLPFEARRVIARAHWQHLTAEERAAFGPFESQTGSSITVPADCFVYFPPLAEHDQTNALGKQERDGIYDEDLSARIAINVVTPLMDTQNLALGSSSARQIELAMQIAGALGGGSPGSASVFANWAKLNRRDTVTMSTLAAANAYSMGDSLFGFEVGNRLRGMANPEADDGKAGMVLERQTFPALLMLGMHEEEAGPKLVRNDKGEPEVWMPELNISYNTRWSRHTRGWLWGAFDRNRSPSESYKSRNDLARAASTMHSPRDPLDQHVDPWSGESVDLFSAKKNLSRDYQVMTCSYFGSVLHTPLPAEFLVAPEDVETSLQDPKDKLVRAAELAVYPSDRVIQSNAAKASAATETLYMIITGKNLDQVNLAGITVQGDGFQSLTLDPTKPLPAPSEPPTPAPLPMPVLLGPTAIALYVKVTGGADEDAVPVAGPPAKLQTRKHFFQFELPITAGSPILEMMKEKSVFTQRCSYVFELPPPAPKPDKKPELISLLRDKISAPGTVDADKKLKGSIDVMIKGSGLEGWKQDEVEITVHPEGRGTYRKDSLSTLGDAGLFLTLDVEGAGAQATFISFKPKNGGIYYSPPFEYTLTPQQ